MTLSRTLCVSSAVLCLVTQSCRTLCSPMDCSPPDCSVHGDSPGKNTGVGCHTLLQGIFPTQRSNPGLPYCRHILYHLSHQGRPPRSVQSFSHVRLFEPVDCSMPGFPVHHQFPELAQTHVHRVGDAIQPSHPLSSPSTTTFNLSQHQGLFQWISSLHQVAKVLELQLQHQSFQFRTDFL